MRSTIMDPTVGTSAGFTVEPTDVLTMEDIHIPMEDIMGAIDLTPMEAMEPTEATEGMEDIIVRINFGPYRVPTAC